jgi:hypothetical protein
MVAVVVEQDTGGAGCQEVLKIHPFLFIEKNL